MVLFLSAVLFSSLGFAQARTVVASAKFIKPGVHHTYTILQSDSGYEISFQNGKRAPVHKPLSDSEKSRITHQIDRILWQSKYKHPHASSCTHYAHFATRLDQGWVCGEDLSDTGMAYGLFNSLRRLFERDVASH